VSSRLYTTEVELYDIAFSWDVEEEVDWLVDRLGGPRVRSVLEPACGSGRILEAFARRGIEAVGIDISPTMVEFANRRLAAAGLPGLAFEANMVSFDFDRTFHGAVCPIDSVAYLLDRAAIREHLNAVARHLRPGGKYLVQLELRSERNPWAGVEDSVWEEERAGVRLAITWKVLDIDVARGVETQRGRIEILSGPERGRIVEEEQVLAAWTPDNWAALIDDSPFSYAAVFDGNVDGRPPLPIGTAGRLLWHELAL
jgi:SAM-dependent methyltransferase